jgi:hypothetical protein
MDPVTKSARVQALADQKLWLRILAFDRCHIATARGAVVNVRHLQRCVRVASQLLRQLSLQGAAA